MLVEQALTELGGDLRAAIDGLTPVDAVGPLLETYRRSGLDHPNLYRLATVGPVAARGAGARGWRTGPASRSCW